MMTTLLCLAPLGPLPWAAVPAGGSFGQEPACATTAHLAARAADHQVRDQLLIKLANCLNVSDTGEQAECLQEAWADYREGVEEAQRVLRARLEVCHLLGEDVYDPAIDPDDFVAGITHPYLPFEVGTTWIYEGRTDNGFEEIHTTVLDEVKVIAGVECTVVRTVETIDGALVEDTVDWYAQDRAGNVWYFGERSLVVSNGEPVDFEGSWQTGTNHAKPGVVMKSDPQVGETYRMEFLLDEAEDVATVASKNASITVGYGTFTQCLQTTDSSPIDPGEEEDKFYAPGVGLVLETNVVTGGTLQLVEVLRP